ncbi:MAG: hypothetical protein CL607_23820 [Anaerolineaceae bacterium]|nr:hypothetical protein [Anaerolineaceae bacterium]
MQHATLTWQGITIAITYKPEAFKSFREHYGTALAHLDIRAREPLPITSTGYCSHYLAQDDVNSSGGPVAYVQQWLDHAATDSDWQLMQSQHQQLPLF